MPVPTLERISAIRPALQIFKENNVPLLYFLKMRKLMLIVDKHLDAQDPKSWADKYGIAHSNNKPSAFLEKLLEELPEVKEGLKNLAEKNNIPIEDMWQSCNLLCMQAQKMSRIAKTLDSPPTSAQRMELAQANIGMSELSTVIMAARADEIAPLIRKHGGNLEKIHTEFKHSERLSTFYRLGTIAQTLNDARHWAADLHSEFGLKLGISPNIVLASLNTLAQPDMQETIPLNALYIAKRNKITNNEPITLDSLATDKHIAKTIRSILENQKELLQEHQTIFTALGIPTTFEQMIPFSATHHDHVNTQGAAVASR